MSNFSIPDLFGVTGQVVLVTGGGTGLGKQIAAAFSSNGAKVYISGRRVEVLEETSKELSIAAKASGGEVIAIKGDVSSKNGCKAIAEAVAAKETNLDTLVNCAGVLRHWGKTGNHDEPHDVEEILNSVEDEDFTFTNNINVSGVYFTTVACLPLLRKSDKANVINIASIGALHLGRRVGSLTYGVSKAGTVFLSQQLAGRLTPFKIRVNVICPGIFPSEMTGADESKLPDTVKAAIQTIPAKRMGEPQEIAGPCLMLASKAGGYMNNACLVVDGGRLMTMSINN